MNYLKVLICSALMLIPGVAFGQQAKEGLPPHCTVAQLAAGTCAPALPGMRVRITDGNLAIDPDCTAGVGAVSLVCEFTVGGAWITAPAIGADSLDFDDFMDIMTLDADTNIVVATGLEFTITADAQVGIDEILTILLDQDDDADATDVLQAIRIELASESGDAGDLLYGIMMTVEEGTANTIIDAGIHIDNEETTAGTLTDAIIVTSSGVNAGITDAIDVSAANITNAINVGPNTIVGGNDETLTVGAIDSMLILTVDGAENPTFIGVDGGAPAHTIFDTWGAGTVQAGSADVTGIILRTAGDVTIPPFDDTANYAPNEMTADPAVQPQFVGLPKMGVTYIASVGDGTATVAAANPLIANCNAIVNGAEADDATNFITGASSYQYTWAADVATDDGIDCVIAYPANDDPTSLGFWFRTDTVITAGDIDINFDDGGVQECTVATLAVGAGDLDIWMWIEVNITAACAGKGDGTDGIEFLATAQGAAVGVLDNAVMNIDQLAMWDLAVEEPIGNILVGGLIDFSYVLIAAGGANSRIQGVEWASHFINYQTGTDMLVPITDLQLYQGQTLEALE